MRLNQDLIQRMFDGRGGVAGGGSSLDPGLIAGLATEMWTEENYVSKTFFNELFVIHKKTTTTVYDGDTVVSTTVDTSGTFAPNEIPSQEESTDEETGYRTVVVTEVDNIEAKKGLWTDFFLSALGLNGSGGGGGIGDVTWQALGDNTDTRQIASSHLTTALGSALAGYATQSWVTSQNYVTSSAISDMATKTWVNNQSFVNWTALGDTTTTQQIALSHLTTALSGYATQSWVNTQGYLTSADLSGYLPLTAGSTKALTGQLVSSVATGTAPISVTSTTVCTNLNADLLDGQHGSYYATAASLSNYLPLTAGSTYPLTGQLYITLSGSGYKPGVILKSNLENVSYITLKNSSDAVLLDLGYAKGSTFGIDNNGGFYAYSRLSGKVIYLGNSGIYFSDSSSDFDKYLVWDAHNSNLSTVDWTCKDLSSSNIVFLQNNESIKGYIGTVSYSWSGNDVYSYPTLYGIERSNNNAYIMILTPHIPFLENGKRSYTGSTFGAIIRMEASTTSNAYWDVGIKTADTFSITRSGTYLLGLSNTGLLTAYGGLLIPSGKTIKIGDIYIGFDSINNAIKVYKLDANDQEIAANLYATGGVSALGYGVNGGGGAGDVTWDALRDNTDERQIALSHLTTALSGYALVSSLSNYLPLTGGSLSRDVSQILIINSTISSGNGSCIAFYRNSVKKGEVGYWDDAGTYMQNNSSYGALFCLHDNGYAVLSGKNAWQNSYKIRFGRSDTSILNGTACIGVTNGNLHLDAYNGYAIFLNAYQDDSTATEYKKVYFNGSSYWIDKDGYYNGSVSWSNVNNRPTNISSFTNDSGYITSSALSSYLPLSAGSSTPLTGILYITRPSSASNSLCLNMTSGNGNSSFLRCVTTDNNNTDIGFLKGSTWGVSNAGGAYIWASSGGGLFVSAEGLYYTDDSNDLDKNTVYHTGNLSPLTTTNYSSYCLPLTGGTLSGNVEFSNINNKGHLGGVSYSWGGVNDLFTIWSSETSSAAVCITSPHIPFLKQNTKGWTAATVGSRIRMQDSGSGYWDIGVDSNNCFYTKHPSYSNKLLMTNNYNFIGGSTGLQTWRAGSTVVGIDGYRKIVIGQLSSDAIVGAHNSALNAWDVLTFAGSAVVYKFEASNTVLYLGNSLVGINTSSPSYALHVVGSIYSSSDITAAGAAHSQSIELNESGGLSGYGGFIDFHYNGTLQDYSLRLIEAPNPYTSGDWSGILQLQAKQTSNGSAKRAGLVVGAGIDASFIQIGNGRIIWDDTNHALRIIRVDSSGNSQEGNLYATGSISAIGYQSGGGGGGSTGVFSTSITPDTTGVYDLGTSTYKWRNLYLAGANGGNGFSIMTSYNSYVYIGSVNKIHFGSSDVEFEDTVYVENRMGIGTKNGNYDLYVYGENEGNAYFWGDVSVASLTNRSDMRLKDVVGDVNLSVQQIASAPAFKFRFKEKAKRTMVGTSAQYWDAVLPESVTRDADGILGLDYGVTALVSTIILAKGMTEHERRITKLEKENAELRARIKDLEEN